MKRLILPLLTVLALCGFKPPLPPGHDPGPVHLSVIDRDDGQPLHQYRAQGQRWVAGQQGHRYSVRLRNAGPTRVLVVLSVDGLNAITGEVAAPGQTGYVLNPWQTADIHGWRKSSQEVAQFVFTDPGRSYAARTDRPDNIGVIGIAVFNEAGALSAQRRPAIARPQARPAPAQAEAAMDAAASRMASAAPAPALGTGHGQREQSQVRDTDFERATRMPAQTVEVRYDSTRNLRARGILVTPAAGEAARPQAFPAQYVPDPPGSRLPR